MSLNSITMIKRGLLISVILVMILSVSVNADASSYEAADFWSNLNWTLSNVVPAEPLSITEQVVYNNPFGSRFDKSQYYSSLGNSALFVNADWNTVYESSKNWTFTIDLGKTYTFDYGYCYFFETLINGISTYLDGYSSPYDLWYISNVTTFSSSNAQLTSRQWSAISISSSNTSNYNSYGVYINRGKLWTLDLRNVTSDYSFNTIRFTFSVGTSATQVYGNGHFSLYLSDLVRYIYDEDLNSGWNIIGPPSPPFIASPDLLSLDAVLGAASVNNNASSILSSVINAYTSADVHAAALFLQNLYSAYLFPSVVLLLVTLGLGFLVIKTFLGR